MLDLAFQRASVTGEWYIPGHMLSGFRCGLSGGVSKGEATVGRTGIVIDEADGETLSGVTGSIGEPAGPL